MDAGARRWASWLVLALVAAYAGWRILVADPTTVAGVATLLVDLHGAGLAAMVLAVLARPRVLPPTGEFTGTADIFIPTLNEPLDVLEPTVLGAGLVRGVNRVHVLDDGGRDEVAAMAGRLGAAYHRRSGSEHAKAGNLNAALPGSDADLILILDADQVPVPEILERTTPAFADPRMALVQTPQGFYNTESLAYRRDEPIGEQDIFYYCLEPAKNADNSAFWIGSGGVLRRQAVVEIGGFATGSVTEDIHTTMRLHARGWRTYFLPRAYSFGLEAGNLREFHRQRRRWAAGNLHILLRSADSPFRLRGLRFVQRLHYVAALAGHLQGAQRLALIGTLMLLAVTGTSPVTGDFRWYAAVTLLFAAAVAVATRALSGRRYHPVHSETHVVSAMLPQVAGLGAALAGDRRFSASRKTVNRSAGTPHKRLYQAIALAMAACPVALAAGELNEVRLWAAALLLAHLGLVVLFLRHVRRFERADQVLPYAELDPASLHAYVCARFGERPPRPVPVPLP